MVSWETEPAGSSNWPPKRPAGAIPYPPSGAGGSPTKPRSTSPTSNFHDYRWLPFEEMPEVEVHIVTKAEPPTKVGEMAVPPIAPAVANAVFAATGTRLRTLLPDP